MKISRKSKYLALTILFIVVSTLAYGLGTVRGFYQGVDQGMITENCINTLTALIILEDYRSGKNEDLEQALELKLDMHIESTLLLTATYEKFNKAPLVVKVILKNLMPEFQLKDVVNKTLARAAEYRSENTGVYLDPSEENYRLLMTYLPKDSMNHITD